MATHFLAGRERLFATAVACWLSTTSATPSFAQQTGEINGVVRSQLDSSAVTDAFVFIQSKRRSTVTASSGRFRIAGLPPGRHRVVVQRIGFASDSAEVDLRPAEAARIVFTLRNAAVIISPVVVSAIRELQSRAEGSVTIDAIGATEIAQARAAHPAALMNRLPGVHVAELSGEGHSMAMRQPITTKPMYLYLEDGVPTRPTGFFNHNALYEVNLPQAGGLEVIKGPGTALFGSDAIGGVVNVLTRPAPHEPEVQASVEAAGYGYRRMLATGGFTRGNHGLRADANVTHSDNWKEQAPFDRASGTLRWDAVLAGTGWTARTVLAGSMIDQQDVPAISRATFDTAFQANLAPIAYRRVRALRLSTALERDGGTSTWSVTPFARLNRMELLPSWQLTFDPQTWDTRNSSLGLLVKYRRDFAPLQTRLIVGADADQSPGSFFARQAVVTRTAGVWSTYTDGATHYDYDVTYRQVAPYVHLEFSPIAKLRVDAGLRSDHVGYDYDSHLTPLDTGAHRRPASTTVSYSHLSPKLGASYEWSRAINLFASYRHGFRAPSQGQLFQQNSAANTVDLEPVAVNSYEVGLRGQIGARVVYQIAGYDMAIRNDIITYRTAQNTNEATNAGQTRHRGLELSSAIALTETVRLDGSWSWSNQRYVDWEPQAGVTFSGNRIEQAPRELGNVMATWSPRWLRGGRAALEWSRTGRYATDPANTHEYGGYDLVTAHANVLLGRRSELFMRVVNLGGRRFAELVTWDRFQQDQFTPGSPRMVYAGVRHALY